VSENELVVVLNPHAAKGKAMGKQEKIVRYLRAGGFSCTVTRTEKEGDATRFAYDAVASGVGTIVAAGGDGTVNEVANGMLRSARDHSLPVPALGVVPIGRGNDFAWTMGIPVSIRKACAIIVAGKKRIIDAGFSRGGNYPDGRYFVNGEGIGFEPLVNFTASGFRHVSGTLSYVLALGCILIHYPAPMRLRLTVDGKESVVETQQVSICNGRRMGSAFLMGPDAVVDDGLFDIVYANRPIRNSRLLPVALHFFNGSQVRLPSFSVVRGTSVSLVSEDNPMPVHVDGEEISRSCMEICVELVPKTLPVFVS
jgi:YegS/Rv2252/BmrU family lipid kinase